MLWTFLHEVDRSRIRPLVVFLEDGPFVQEVRALGHRVELVRSGRLRQVAHGALAVGRIAAILHRERPALVLNWVAKAQLYGSCAALAAGMPPRRVVWWQHGVPHGHWMDRLATALPAGAVGCSSAAAARAQARTRPRRATFVVHPGVMRSPGEEAPRAQVSVPHGRTVVGILGRLQAWKGQHRVLRAVARLRERGLDVHALIVGGTAHGFSPGYEPYLRRLTHELGLAGAVTMTGQVPDPAPYLRAMDILVSASLNEPFGIVLLEAMDAGLPVVAVGDAGPREIVEPGRTGTLVPSPDPELLADAIEPLVRDAALRRRLGEAGRRRVQEQFTARAMAERLETALVRLAEGAAA